MSSEASPAPARRRHRQNGIRTVSFRIGRRVITQIGAEAPSWRETYHFVLGLNWFQFLALVAVLYFAINALFGAAYWLVPGSLANARPGKFSDAFFFSVETLSTVGYGEWSPATFYGHMVASIESFVGLLAVAMTTGIVFVRFSRPRARIMFSREAVVAPFNGVPTLMIRAANERHNLLLEASVRVTLIRREVTLEGVTIRRLIDLPLVRDQNPTFVLTWTVMHAIDAGSPLYGRTEEQLAESQETMVVSIVGIDETLNETVYARQEYRLGMIRFNHRFIDVVTQDGERTTVDLRRLHDLTPIEAAASKAGSSPTPRTPDGSS